MATDPVNPSHYKAETADGYPLEPIDVIEAFGVCPHVALALKHLLRHGRKPAEPLVQDLMKARWYVDRKINVLLAEAAGEPAEEPEPAEEVEIEVAGGTERDYADAIRKYARRHR